MAWTASLALAYFCKRNLKNETQEIHGVNKIMEKSTAKSSHSEGVSGGGAPIPSRTRLMLMLWRSPGNLGLGSLSANGMVLS